MNATSRSSVQTALQMAAERVPVVVACCRTAIGRSHPERGLFRLVRGDALAAAVVKSVVDRSGVDPKTIEDVVFGATQQRGELGGNVARIVALLAGLPLSVAGTTVNRLCGSGLHLWRRHAIRFPQARKMCRWWGGWSTCITCRWILRSTYIPRHLPDPAAACFRWG